MLDNPKPVFGSESELEARFVHGFDETMRRAGYELLLIDRQTKLLGGRLDLIALDEHGTPWIIELKKGIASPTIVTQVLRYTAILNKMSFDEICALDTVDAEVESIAERFRNRFGRQITVQTDRPPKVMLVASEYDATVRQVIAALKSFDVPIIAHEYCIDETSRSVVLKPIGVSQQLVRPQPASTVSVRPAELKPALGLDEQSSFRFVIHEEVEQFWSEFCANYPFPIAPIAVIAEQFSLWQAERGALFLSQAPRNSGLLAREFKELATRYGDWERVYVGREHDGPEAVDPTTPLEARSWRGLPFTRVAYVRRSDFADCIDLVG